MKKDLNIQFEKAVRLLVKYFSVSDKNSRKPILFHDIRAGVYLYENGYGEEIVLAGTLHDAIEWSEITEDIIRGEFGEKVLELVLANSKDSSIKDKDERNRDMIKRCIYLGEDALIIRTADILDSFKWYESQNNEEELMGHCVKNANLILEYKPEEFNDKIFNELKVWRDKYISK